MHVPVYVDKEWVSITTTEGEEFVRANVSTQVQQMQVVCPVGISCGALIAVNTPDGRQMQVQVPQNVTPGMPFYVNIMPASAAAGEPSNLRQLRILHKATVRESANVRSREVGVLVPGEVVPWLEEGMDNSSGHLRVRIGDNQWISRVTPGNNALAYEPTTPGVSKLQVVQTATVRSGAGVDSNKVGELTRGTVVVAHEELELGGHVRVRITVERGQDQWISRVTAKGALLAELFV
eukprot:COSAG02_NODE_189_length_30109_cov_71.135855_4_plen_236_part_00